ncbi:hypothetical protein [Streptomyces nigrescens]|uniref:hypothetical protein n=1 Tax=Streptomyces nigrescens TaxID=1920 RepID=UPI00346BEFAE
MPMFYPSSSNGAGAGRVEVLFMVCAVPGQFALLHTRAGLLRCSGTGDEVELRG